MRGPKILDRPNGAVFSPSRMYRYLLWRRVGIDLMATPSMEKRILWLLVNPSDGNEFADDQTIHKVKAISTMHGFTTAMIANPFAFVSKDIAHFQDMERKGFDVVGPNNDFYIDFALARCSEVVCGWSHYGKLRGRSAQLMEKIILSGKIPKAVRINLDGTPAHPLYLPADNCPFLILP